MTDAVGIWKRLLRTHLLMSVILVAGVGLTMVTCSEPRESTQDSSARVSAYDRVLSDGVIRAGYVPYPPGCIKDPNSGGLTGVFVETLEASAASLGLRVDWVEEVGWGTMIEGLKSNRYDMVGSPVWANASRARHADFTAPLFYSGIGVFVRADFAPASSGLEWIDSPQVAVATIDGEMSQIIKEDQFPQASVNSLPQLTDHAQLLLNVTERKADVTFVEPFIANRFLASNPGSLKNLVPTDPVRVFPNTMMINSGEDAFRQMLDVALSEQINRGLVDRLLEKYGGETRSFYRVARPYQAR